MKKKLLLVALGAILLSFLTACSDIDKNDDVSISGSVAVTNDDVLSSQEVIKGDLNDLMEKGKIMKCTFELQKDKVKQSGEAYINKENARVDMISSIDGNISEAHMIVSDDFTYTWTSETEDSNGFKTKTEKNVSGAENDDNKTTFTCNPWNLEKNKFELPKEVNFGDDK